MRKYGISYKSEGTTNPESMNPDFFFPPPKLEPSHHKDTTSNIINMPLVFKFACTNYYIKWIYVFLPSGCEQHRLFLNRHTNEVYYNIRAHC